MVTWPALIVGMAISGCADPGPTPDEMLRTLPKPPISASATLPDAPYPADASGPQKSAEMVSVKTGERLEVKGRIRVGAKDDFRNRACRVEIVRPGRSGKPSISLSWLLHVPEQQPEPNTFEYDGFARIRLAPGDYTLNVKRRDEVLVSSTLRVVP